MEFTGNQVSDAGPSNAGQDSGAGAGPSNAGQDYGAVALVGGLGADAGFGLGHQNPFGAFTRSGMMSRVDENRDDLRLTKRDFIRHMGLAGGDTRVVAVHHHRNNVVYRGRLAGFDTLSEKMKRIYPESKPLVALYGGCKAEISLIIDKGFTFINAIGWSTGGAELSSAVETGTSDEVFKILETEFEDVQAKGGCHGSIHLVPKHYCLDAASSCDVDEAGLRHVLVCRVNSGKQQLLAPNVLNQLCPVYDSGVDRRDNPTRFYIPLSRSRDCICERISVESVISFQVPASLMALASHPALQRPSFFGAAQPVPGSIELPAVIERLQLLLTADEFSFAAETFHAYKEKRISRQELIENLRDRVGGQLLVAAAKIASEANAWIE